ncbi:hypothetical protein A1359_00150 [Methylomonas lenta]|uniref:Secreted protein n=1 Tax=Methylomonas lenta TaxID=980561 RepID=A0A177NGI5_9GAMM|nr:hypothetical protein [Methylomonas lenta]OAI17005.1 hypothetical protein A1359_00150 [Methylomonas lenta]
MKKFSCLLAPLFALAYAGSVSAQGYPILDMVANKVIQKYQQSNCEQLWQHKEQPKSAEEQELLQMLVNNPQIRSIFIDKVSPTIVNKMFECGMIP